jgi:hypothetical protein
VIHTSGLIFFLIIVLSVVGNVLVLVAIASNSCLQIPCNCFLASLAIADLGVSSPLVQIFLSRKKYGV